MIGFSVPATDIANASATATTAGIITIPGGRYFSADIQLSCTTALAGTAEPKVTVNVPGGTTGAAPANGSIVARIVSTGLLASSTATSSVTEVLIYGGDNGCTLDYTAGASGSSTVVINGVFF